jgi:hypothetical protein
MLSSVVHDPPQTLRAIDGSTDMKKTYRGSCHCGAVKFEAELDLSEGTGKCNCSICTKQRCWEAFVSPEAFRLLAGEQNLTTYQFGARNMHHLFCKTCGVHAFSSGNIPELGGAFWAVQVACLDDADPAELIAAPVRYFDGRNNAWEREPAETRHL